MQASTSYSRAHAEPFRSSTRPQWSGSGSQRFHHRQHRHAVIAQSERSLSPVSVETADSPTRKSRRLLGKDVAYVETGRPGYFTVDGKLRMQGVDPQLVWQVSGQWARWSSHQRRVRASATRHRVPLCLPSHPSQILTSYEASARVFRNIDESTAHINEDGKLQVFQVRHTVQRQPSQHHRTAVPPVPPHQPAPTATGRTAANLAQPQEQPVARLQHYLVPKSAKPLPLSPTRLPLLHLAAQKAGWRFLAFSGSFECRLAVDEDAEARSLVFTLLQSSFMRDFEGRWSVNEEHVEGVGPAVLVEHQLSVMPMMPVPAPFAYYTRPIFVKQVRSRHALAAACVVVSCAVRAASMPIRTLYCEGCASSVIMRAPCAALACCMVGMHQSCACTAYTHKPTQRRCMCTCVCVCVCVCVMQVEAVLDDLQAELDRLHGSPPPSAN